MQPCADGLQKTLRYCQYPGHGSIILLMELSNRFRVTGGKVRLSKIDPGFTAGIKSKEEAQQALDKNIRRLAELQYKLYAENRRSLLVVLQAMDAGGKDGTIRHVMTGMNPQSCRVHSFKAPTSLEVSHDFLWRVHQQAPARGEVGIFNRSHYEDVLVVRVHDLVPRDIWSQRYDRINQFESLLADSGTTILKFFLHISKAEQLRRLRSRIEDPLKNWKITSADTQERRYWDAYTEAYEEALARCSTKSAPWFVIPADHKWFRNLAVSQIIVETMESMALRFPKPIATLSKVLKTLT